METWGYYRGGLIVQKKRGGGGNRAFPVVMCESIPAASIPPAGGREFLAVNSVLAPWAFANNKILASLHPVISNGAQKSNGLTSEQ